MAMQEVREKHAARLALMALANEHSAEVWNEVSQELHEEYEVTENRYHAEHLRQRAEIARRFAVIRETPK